MNKHVSIKDTKALPSGLDFNDLRLRGIAYVQELSGDIWTDYNVHDPGVTLLEHLCYALTDLAFRAGFDIEDILYAEEGKSAASTSNGFFSPANILPTTPITPTDYRCLLIDQVREIRNAWFYPLDNHHRGYKGLFRVRVQLAEGVNRNLRADKVRKTVRTLLMANRNLCEDLEDIIVLGTECLKLSAKISIEADAFGEKVLARILHTIDQLLNPGIRYYSREELEAEGLTTEEIFDGPVPLHGFIKKEDLKPLPASTYVSTLREAIAKVEGVKLVDHLVVWKEGVRIRGDEIIPSPDTALSLDPTLVDDTGTEGNLTLHRNGVPLSINPRQTRQFLNTLSAKAKRGFQTKLNLSEAPVVSQREKSDLNAYRSFQRLLPAIYGLGPEGLPATANRERRAQAHQLKAYLLLFEQFMADYLAQLAHVKDLFSIAPDVGEEATFEGHTSTYFTQFPADIPDIEHLYYHGLPKTKNGPTKEEIVAAINHDLQRMLARKDPSDQRRTRFLDHLLARFGEIYSDDALRFLEDQTQEEANAALVRAKATFLSKYPELSRERTRAFNYTLPAWENENVSGLKKRVTLSINLSAPGENNLPPYANRDLSPAKFFEAVSWRQRPEPEETTVLSLLTMLRDGAKMANYEVVKQGGKFQLVFRDKAAQLATFKGAAAGAKQAAAQGKVFFTGTRKQCLDTRDRLIARLQKINQAGEGWYFLENILLRPDHAPGALLIFEVPLPGGEQVAQLRSLTFTNERDLNDLSTDLLVLATHAANWAVIADEDAWRAVLLKNGEPLMISLPYATGEAAGQMVRHLMRLCLDIRNHEPASINNYLRQETERFPGYDISAGFYSLRLSIISPAWPALLQQQDFRQLFQQIVATNIPAHLSVDYYWLEPDEMTTFSTLFKAWLEAKKEEDQNNAQQLALRLIHCLRPASRSAGTTTTEPGEAHQKLPATLFNRLGKSFGYSFMFPPTDFSIIQGMPAKLADVLPSLKITEWKALQKASPAALVTAVHAAGQPVTKKQIRSWQKQASLASRKRWSELLRQQRKARQISQTAPLPKAKPAKVEQAIQEVLRHPKAVLGSLRQWVQNLPPEDIVPFAVLDFLIKAIGENFLLPPDDLKIFSCIDEAHEKALKMRGINNWNNVSVMKQRTWASIVRELQSATTGTSLESLQAEARLALAGDWAALKALQQPEIPGSSPTALEQRIAFYQERLMAPASAGQRPLLDQLTYWQQQPVKIDVPRPVVNRLLEVLSYGDLLTRDNFRIFEGVGAQTEAALQAAAIRNWQQLAGSKAPEVLKALEQKLKVVTRKNVEDWIAQASLAHSGKWAKLIEWQKGPVAPQLEEREDITALELAIRRWLERHARPADETRHA